MNLLKIAKQTLLVLTTALITSYAQAEVALPNGEYREEVEEMRVQALGGAVRLSREYVFDRWQINPRWVALKFEQDVLDGSIKTIDRNTGTYVKQGDAWTYNKTMVIRKQVVKALTPGAGEGSAPATLDGPNDTVAGGLPVTSQTGFRWLERTTGNWIDYDANGQIVSYGDRNDIRVWFEYGNGEAATQIQKVRDHFGRTLLTFTWQNGQITEIKDNPNIIPGNTYPQRKVTYQWNGNLLTKATDVMGTEIPYTYDNKRLVKAINPENRPREIAYGPTGRVSSVKEADNSITSYVYDYDKTKREFYVRINHPAVAAGVKVEEHWYNNDGTLIRTDINGRTRRTLQIDTGNRSKTTIDSQGRKTIRTTDEFDNIVQVEYPDGATIKRKFSAVHGGLLEEIDELGVKTTYEYDSKGNRTRQTEAVGYPEQRITEWTYNNFGLLTKLNRKGGTTTLPDNSTITTQDAVTQVSYDNLGNQIQITDPENNIIRAVYNHSGIPVQIVDARSNAWKATYDAKGNQLTQTNPLGKITTNVWNKAGERINITDANNNKTSYIYNNRGRLIEMINALGQSTKQELDLKGQLIAQVNAMNQRVLEQTHDLDGRVAQQKDGNGNTIAYEYGDSCCNQVQQIHYPTFTQQFSYDLRGRGTKTKNVLSDNLSYASENEYNKKGQLIKAVDIGNKVTHLTYNMLGSIAQIVDLSGETKYIHNLRGNLLSVIDAKGNATRYTYDRNGRRLSEIRPLGQILQYHYDEVGNLVEQLDARGNKISYAYDAANRLTKESRTSAGSSSANRVIDYRYNDVGTLMGYTDTQPGNAGAVAHSVEYVIDALQRRLEEKVTYGDNTFTYKTAYSPTGQKAGVTSPSGVLTQYGYDNNQNLASVVLPSGTFSLSDRKWNAPQQITLPGGSVQHREYDPLMRTTRIKTNNTAQSAVMDYRYTFDPVSNITKKVTEHGDYEYGYDDLYRLTEVTNPSGLANEAWTYDAVGNRKTDKVRGGNQEWQVNANNQITKSYTENGDPVTPTWDENGSLIKQETVDNKPELNQQYVYDAQNRLTEVKNKEGQRIALYQYDPFGRRIAKTTTEGTVYYLYSDQGLIAEATPSGTITTEYGWNPQQTWGTDPLTITTTRSGNSEKETFYYLNDHLGTPQQIVDRQGQPVWSAKASAFGETQVQPNLVIANNLRFPGQYYDSETKTHYNFFRDYSSATGTYRQADPIGLAGGMNVYAYATNNPNLFIDPEGLAAYGGIGLGGAFHLLRFGYSVSCGVFASVSDLEICIMCTQCVRVGAGLFIGAGIIVSGGYVDGNASNLEGPSTGYGADLGPMGGSSGSSSSSMGGSKGIRGGPGLGFSFGRDICLTTKGACFTQPCIDYFNEAMRRLRETLQGPAPFSSPSPRTLRELY